MHIQFFHADLPISIEKRQVFFPLGGGGGSRKHFLTKSEPHKMVPVVPPIPPSPTPYTPKFYRQKYILSQLSLEFKYAFSVFSDSESNVVALVKLYWSTSELHEYTWKQNLTHCMFK